MVAHSHKEDTARLQRDLGMSHDEFFNTYFTGQKELAVLADATRPERAAFLSRVLRHEQLTIAQERIRERRNALTHEVAYGGLLHDRQRALHVRITEAIERLAPERVAEQAVRLGHHALRGELWDRAVAYLRQAGHRAMERAANREAVAHLEQALAALRHLPETRQTAELTIDIRIDLRNALLPLGERTRMVEHLNEAEGLARTLGDQHRLGRIATFMVVQCLGSGDYDEAVRFGLEALSIGEALGETSIQVVATTFLGMAHVTRGEFGDAIALLERNLDLKSDVQDQRFGAPVIQPALSRALLADALSQLGI